MPQQSNRKKDKNSQRLSLGQSLLFNRAELQNKDKKVLIEAPGYAKMSAIILDFARPLLALDPEREYFEDTIQVAVIAWNLALALAATPEKTVDDLLVETYGAETIGDDYQAFRDQVAMLVRRKQRYFSKHQRFIHDYQITESEDMFHLNIMSELI